MIRLDMTMSLDRFVAGPDDRPGQEMGRHGFRLFNCLDDLAGPIELEAVRAVQGRDATHLPLGGHADDPHHFVGVRPSAAINPQRVAVPSGWHENVPDATNGRAWQRLSPRW